MVALVVDLAVVTDRPSTAEDIVARSGQCLSLLPGLAAALVGRHASH